MPLWFLSCIGKIIRRKGEGGKESTGISEKQEQVFAVELWCYAGLIPTTKYWHVLIHVVLFSVWSSDLQRLDHKLQLSFPLLCSLSIILTCSCREQCLVHQLSCRRTPARWQCSFPLCSLGPCICIVSLVSLPDRNVLAETQLLQMDVWHFSLEYTQQLAWKFKAAFSKNRRWFNIFREWSYRGY